MYEAHIYTTKQIYTQFDALQSRLNGIKEKKITAEINDREIMLAILDYADRNIVLLARSNLSDIEKAICEALTDAKISPESLR